MQSIADHLGRAHRERRLPEAIKTLLEKNGQELTIGGLSAVIGALLDRNLQRYIGQEAAKESRERERENARTVSAMLTAVNPDAQAALAANNMPAPDISFVSEQLARHYLPALDHKVTRLENQVVELAAELFAVQAFPPM